MTPISAIRRMLIHPHHVIWVVLQQSTVRGLLALKFLMAARYLGPENMGLVGIATLTLAIVESLSDTGLSQAVIQRHQKLGTHEAGAVWTLQMVRGLTISILMLVIAVPVAMLFRVPDSASLIMLAALVPLIRNGFNPGLFLVHRARNFRGISIYEASGAVVDITTTLLLIHLGFGSAAILLGTLASDSVKLFLTWTFFATSLTPTFGWHRIRELTSFGKWIWGASIVTLALNQLDKVLVARFLGAAEFGVYQVASRIAQLIVADGAVALGQYLFPTFAQRRRESMDAANTYLLWVMRRLYLLELIICVLLAVGARFLVAIMLGENWSQAVPILRVMAISMFLGGGIAILVAYCRAIGSPKIVTQAVTVQLIVLIVVAPPLLLFFGGIGMAIASACALLAATLCLAIKIKEGFLL